LLNATDATTTSSSAPASPRILVQRAIVEDVDFDPGQQAKAARRGRQVPVESLDDTQLLA
jgi:hypothetical protein